MRHLKNVSPMVKPTAEAENPWVYDAHRYYAMSIGETKEAIAHWNAFLSNRPDSPYAPEGIKVLKRLSR